MNTADHIYLVRHGETGWTLSGRHTGHTDIPLTARGEDQARKLAPRLRAIRFSHVLASPQQRAVRTCALTGLGAAAEIEPDLEEWDYSDYERGCSVDIRAERADWILFRDGCPHGETPDPAAHPSVRDRKILKQGSIERWENEGGEVLFASGMPSGEENGE